MLAAEVEKQLNLPAPTVGMDPDPYTGYDRNKHNMPYTLVNIYTWFWTTSPWALSSLAKPARVQWLRCPGVLPHWRT